uniref:RNA polymerase Rpb6 n=1 Tax=viral metagenome TaxID=1070528 RepID=A0A6C0BZU4_9ZZZZ
MELAKDSIIEKGSDAEIAIKNPEDSDSLNTDSEDLSDIESSVGELSNIEDIIDGGTDSSGEEEEEDNPGESESKEAVIAPNISPTIEDILKYNGDEKVESDSDADTTDDEDEDYLQKLKNISKDSYIADFHPDSIIHNFDEVLKLSKVSRNKMGNIIDPYHRTIPKLTKYEKAKILGQRAKQIDSGAKAFVNVPPTTLDGYLIALDELKQKKIPFIIRRPIPGGGMEYWPVYELEL